MSRVPEKRKQLVETAKELFYKYGAKRVTIEEICKTAGVSKVTFYKYFENKKGLIRHIRDELVEVGFNRFDRICEMNISYPEKIRLMTEWKVEFFAQMKNEFITELLGVDSVLEETKKRFLRNIVTAQEKGEVRQDLSPGFIWMVTEKLNEIIKEGSWKGVCRDYADFQRQMRTLTFWGLLTRTPGEER